MTTLIIDFNTKAVYSDSRSTSSKEGNPATKFEEDHQKVFHIGEGKVVTGCGCADTLKLAANGLLNGRLDFLPKTKEYATIYVVSKKGDILEVEEYRTNKRSWLTGYYSWERIYDRVTLKDSWITAGSGGDYAAGALKQGATPEEAINVASILDEYTNNVVQKIEL